MTRTAVVPALALLAAVLVQGDRLAGQTRPSDAMLRADVERQFEVLPLRDGLALRPRDASRGIRSVEVTQGPIAVDGQPVTGAELRDKLGASDADLVIALSYLTDNERREMFRAGTVSAPEPAVAPPSVMPPAVAPPAVAPPGEREPVFPGFGGRPRGRGNGDRVRVGSSITVPQGEVVDGDVVAVGGAVSVDGEVRGDVVAVGGGITLGPHASVSNNVVAVGGALRRDPGAQIGGRVQEIGIGSFDFSRLRSTGNPLLRGRPIGSALALVGTLTRLAILCLLTAAVVLIGPGYVEQSGDRAATETFKAGAIGFLAQILFLPVLLITVVLLVITIVGIPMLLLIPFLLLGLAIVSLVGFTGVARRLGAWIAERSGWGAGSPYLTTITGVVLIVSPLVLARLIGLGGGASARFAFGLAVIGTLLEYVAWTVGFGAVALARFGHRETPTHDATPVTAPA